MSKNFSLNSGETLKVPLVIVYLIMYHEVNLKYFVKRSSWIQIKHPKYSSLNILTKYIHVGEKTKNKIKHPE